MSVIDTSITAPCQVHFSDRDSFERKKQSFTQAGLNSLQIISDFDRTITAFASFSSHGCLEKSPFLPEEYRALTLKLTEKYRPMEMSVTLPHDEQLQAMVEWWSSAHELLIKYNLNSSHVESSVASALEKRNIYLRARASELLTFAQKHEIPVSILSAGLAPVIRSFINLEKLSSSSLSIFANDIDFDTQSGAAVSFNKNVIHSMNKDARALISSSFWADQKLASRTHVLLFGDSLGDVKMATGLSDDFQVLSFGFLVCKTQSELDAALPQYLQKFDVVITSFTASDNSSFEFVLDLLSQIQQ